MFNTAYAALAGLNRIRKTRAPKLGVGYVSSVLRTGGIHPDNLSITPLQGKSGFQCFYYRIEASDQGRTDAYFASMPDKLSGLLCRVSDAVRLGGLRFGSQLERKRKDYLDLRFLVGHGVPATNPVAFDENTGFLIEDFVDGTNLENFLDNRDYYEHTKLDKCRQGLYALRGVQALGKRFGEPLPPNFMVRSADGKVLINDMEGESVLVNPEEHELAICVYSMSARMRPEKIVGLARELYSAKTIEGLSRYVQHLLLVASPLSLRKTTNTIKGL